MKPDSLEHLLDQYMHHMCVRFGYCPPPKKTKALSQREPWLGAEKFVEDFMRADGISHIEQPKHYQKMLDELRKMLLNWAED